MTALSPFTLPAVTQTISVTTSSAATALTTTSGSTLVLGVPSTGEIAYVAAGDSTVEATVAGSYPIFPGSKEAFAIPAGTTHIAAIGSSASTLYVSRGEGQ